MSENDTPEKILFSVILPLTRVWHQVPPHDVAALRDRIMRIHTEYSDQPRVITRTLTDSIRTKDGAA